MKITTEEIELYNREELITSVITVEQIGFNLFRTIANEIVDIRLNYKTEFRTKINGKGQHEITTITKESDFITRKFNLTPEFKESEYRLLGAEIVKEGGFWQVDFGNMATVNLPKDSEIDLDEVFKVFKFEPVEIKE